MKNHYDMNGPLYEFSDATVGELQEIMEMLPDLRDYALHLVDMWIEGNAYYAMGYETGTRWFIEFLREESRREDA